MRFFQRNIWLCIIISCVAFWVTSIGGVVYLVNLLS